LGNDFNYLCPKCKKGDNLSIEIKVWATLCPDGTDVEGQDHEWEDTSRAICKCGWEGTVSRRAAVEGAGLGFNLA
jgi:hypothetical protein